ncbi:Uncharacterised protein [Campylobacter hyointestinalis]|uniref:Uncharacterized protein n=1 Tax=Campylobacter hyointestinalis subsp. hyointestinalis TaxID=91352 RepID=A0A0S4SSP0_CAMHY|nr:hypothetical protein [Campylobacter hyointestinalis]CUU80944.1 Uncharacterised protein [Campylobacter hyointestinalis subsp. hyointestinalis]CUU84637.1 Uncharacterised protein [Campylobacter hyointestinalis subsp. hyointestinalis]CUU89199.1 Uncharacterised protein [Campylobacter hyointestinalis]
MFEFALPCLLKPPKTFPPIVPLFTVTLFFEKLVTLGASELSIPKTVLRVVPGVVVPPTGSYTIVSPAIAFIAVRLKKMQKVLSSSTPPRYI